MIGNVIYGKSGGPKISPKSITFGAADSYGWIKLNIECPECKEEYHNVLMAPVNKHSVYEYYNCIECGLKMFVDTKW